MKTIATDCIVQPPSRTRQHDFCVFVERRVEFFTTVWFVIRQKGKDIPFGFRQRVQDRIRVDVRVTEKGKKTKELFRVKMSVNFVSQKVKDIKDGWS